MEYIQSPGRMEYLTGKKPEGCIFCKDHGRDEDLVLYEGTHCYVIMNKYPYNSGHLLIPPFRHVSSIQEMSMDEKIEMLNLVDLCVEIMKRTMNPDGFNIGLNMGKSAGAGVADHLHLHIVPRWPGDTNFATVLGDIRVIPEGVKETRNMLLPFFANNKED